MIFWSSVAGEFLFKFLGVLWSGSAGQSCIKPIFYPEMISEIGMCLSVVFVGLIAFQKSSLDTKSSCDALDVR
jgi:hypothetical protein